MKKLAILICISLAYLYSFSQKNFLPGTIITINGESRVGEIDYRKWTVNPSTILFRRDKFTTAKSYGVNDVQSFTVSEDRYVRAVVSIYDRKDNVNHLPFGDTMVARLDTVFLLTVVSGPKSLFQYTNNVDHFYISNENGYEFLVYKKYKVSKEVLMLDVIYTPRDQVYVATNKGYLSQLKTYLSGCEAINEKARYDQNGLKSLFASYYDCIGKDPEFHMETRQKFEFGLLGGVSSTKFKMSQSKDNIANKINYSPSTNSAVGAFIELAFPRSRNLSFNNELIYTSFQTDGYYKYISSPVTYDEYTYTFKYSHVKLNTMVRYKLLFSNIAIYINAGVSNGFLINDQNSLEKVHTFNVDKTTTTSAPFEEIKLHELGILGGAGVKINRLSLELRGEHGNGPFKSPNKANIMRYFALLGYRIN